LEKSCIKANEFEELVILFSVIPSNDEAEPAVHREDLQHLHEAVNLPAYSIHGSSTELSLESNGLAVRFLVKDRRP
jgi:hypothetical protein